MTPARFIKTKTGDKTESKTRSVNITRAHHDFLEEQNLNLSLIVRERVDELMGVKSMNIDETKIKFEVLCHPENTELRGNFLDSGNKTEDRLAEDAALIQLESGNQWVWCTVEVRASLPGVDGITGTDFLGCCSYASRADFESGDYFSDMKETAKRELIEKLESARAALDSALKR